MGKIACAHPGKLGDALYALPAMRALAARHGTKVDFYTSEYCQPLVKLFERQSCVDRVVVLKNYKVESYNCGAQPWKMPVPVGYQATYQLGFRTTPPGPIPDYIAHLAELPARLPISYEFDQKTTLDEPYIVTAPRTPTTFGPMFFELAETSPLRVVEVGAATEGSGSKRALDMTGLDMLDTLSWIARSQGFVGLMSSMLVLANGFPIPRISPHDAHSWDMSHVVRSPLNYYPVKPTAQQVLDILIPRESAEPPPPPRRILVQVPAPAAAAVRRGKKRRPVVFRRRGRRSGL